jgi:two-component system KDP operon response regulator KdpE
VQESTPARALVEGISEEVAQLNGYIQNLLNATRVAAGGLTPPLEWADPRDIVNAAIRRTARRLQAHKVEVAFAEHLPLVKVDSGLIEESCGQLLGNAAKYSPSGSTISVKLHAERKQVVLTVVDQGVGLTPNEQTQLGRRSFRGERHQATIPGSGLGFWIASTFVRANGGTLNVASKGCGLGTTVSISLPASQPDIPELKHSNMNKPANIVLLIDDEPRIRRFLRAGFELNGFAVLEAENAAEALKIATFSPPDLIILDLALPDMHGTEVLERLRSWSNVPIIILSVVSSEDEKVQLLQAGADDYVVKPFGMAELLARGEAALRRFFKSATESPIVIAGPLSVDLVTRTVSLNNSQIRLTRKEYRLLHILAMHVGLVVTHDQLLKEIWTGNQRENIQYLRILVRKLRKKIETDPNAPRLLVTESGVGYRLQNRLEASLAD